MNKLTAMRVFAAVADRGSFTAAAETLAMSRAMASKYVSFLEDDLGARLFNRTTRRLGLTEVGRAYLEKVKNILTEVEEAELSVKSQQSKPSGTLKLMAPPSFGSFHLARAISAYKQHYPEVIFDMTLTDRTPDLMDEGMDVAIHLGELQDSSLVARKLSSSRRVLCGSPLYLKKYGTPAVPEELERFNCLTVTRWTAFSEWNFIVDGNPVKMKVSGNIRSNIADTLRTAAINDCGLVQLPSYIIGLDIKAGRLTPILEQYEPDKLPIYAIYSHRKHLSAKVRVFVDYIMDFFQSPAYWDMWMFEN